MTRDMGQKENMFNFDYLKLAVWLTIHLFNKTSFAHHLYFERFVQQVHVIFGLSDNTVIYFSSEFDGQ